MWVVTHAFDIDENNSCTKVFANQIIVIVPVMEGQSAMLIQVSTHFDDGFKNIILLHQHLQ